MKRYWLLVTTLLMLATPAFAQLTDQTAVLNAVKAENPAAWQCAHTDRSCAWDYIKLVACKLNPDGKGPWGLNGRRGDPSPSKMSWDALNYCGSGPASDPTQGCKASLTIIDVIAGAGGPNPQVIWMPFTNDPTAGAWIKPTGCSGVTPTPVPVPQPQPPAPSFPQYPADESTVDGAGLALFSDFSASGQDPNAQMFRFAFRIAYDWITGNKPILSESVRKHRFEWRSIMGNATGDRCPEIVPGTDGMMTPPLVCLLKRGHGGPHK